ncbi:MAG: MFS transporter [Anaerolineales bacterium]|nr:MFS transporter [Anaerolineales bacterium]MCB0006371.1 MFS transporter [Anaerolineales bacterium]MCB0012947.1 MFS transporter [Anaerolineales bacterium]MCB0019330.1 MFS transporter [Anaerolineales bacterium]MCB0031421.1 MFS transporter [Anaerolineales bacterium]
MFRSYLTFLQANPRYRSLWYGSIVSQFGDWFNLIASTSLIALLTDAGTAISYLFLARFLPLFLVSPFAGSLADRFDRRWLMIVSDLLRAVTVLGFLLVRDASDIWLLYLLTVIQFSLSALFNPARSALLANVVKERDLVTATALDGLTWSSMLALGALVGGVVANVFGLTAAFTIDALTFLLSAWLISRIKVTSQVVSEGAPAGLRSIWQGLQYLVGVPAILIIAMLKGAASLAYGGLEVLNVPFAEDIFPLGEGATATLGVFYTVAGLGTGLGPLLMRRWLGDQPDRLLLGIKISFVMIVIGILAGAAAPTLWLFCLALLIRTVGTGTIWVFSGSLLQIVAPDRFRGRVFAFDFAFLTLTQSISILWAGFALDNLSWSAAQTMTFIGAMSVLVFLIWTVAQARLSKIRASSLTEG